MQGYSNMESARQILKNNPHFVNFMSQMKGKEIIKTLQSNPQALEEVLTWIVGNGHDKTFKKCRANIADDCAGVGPADEFEGRRCRVCANKYRQLQRRERKRRERKKKRRTYKNLTSSDDDSSDDDTIHKRIEKNIVSELARASKSTKTTTLQMCTVTSLDGHRDDETYADYEAYNESSDEYSDVSSTSSESECEKSKRRKRKSTRKGRK